MKKTIDTSKIKKISKSIDTKLDKVKKKVSKNVKDTMEMAKENEVGKKVADSLSLLLIL